jgi:hypothetical protein
MQPPAPGRRDVHSQSVAITRWLALSIVAVPDDKRGLQYLTVRRNLGDSLRRFGKSGIKAEEYLNKKMDVIREMVREIEDALRAEADTA